MTNWADYTIRTTSGLKVPIVLTPERPTATRQVEYVEHCIVMLDEPSTIFCDSRHDEQADLQKRKFTGVFDSYGVVTSDIPCNTGLLNNVIVDNRPKCLL